MDPSWAPGLKALVRKHKYDFAAAAAEVGSTAKELRVELARPAATAVATTAAAGS